MVVYKIEKITDCGSSSLGTYLDFETAKDRVESYLTGVDTWENVYGCRITETGTNHSWMYYAADYVEEEEEEIW